MEVWTRGWRGRVPCFHRLCERNVRPGGGEPCEMVRLRRQEADCPVVGIEQVVHEVWGHGPHDQEDQGYDGNGDGSPTPVAPA